MGGFGNVMVDDEGSMIRKGEVGEGKGKLTVKQQAVWDALNEEFFSKFPGMLEVERGRPIARSSRVMRPRLLSFDSDFLQRCSAQQYSIRTSTTTVFFTVCFRSTCLTVRGIP